MEEAVLEPVAEDAPDLDGVEVLDPVKEPDGVAVPEDEDVAEEVVKHCDGGRGTITTSPSPPRLAAFSHPPLPSQHQHEPCPTIPDQ